MVIADFYVPYLCKSDCPPIAYVFPAPPADPEDPDEEMPTVSIEPTVFCIEDKKEYTIKTSPVGGKLTLNGKENSSEIVPERLGVGTFEVVYTLESGVSATAQFTVQKTVEAVFEIAAAEYSDDGSNWKLTLKATTPAIGELKSQWLMDGKLIAENQSEVSQVLTPNNPKSAIGYAIRESVCGAAEHTRVFIREEQARTIDAEAPSVTIPVAASGPISLVVAPKGTTVTANALVIVPAQMTPEERKRSIIAYYYPKGDEVILTVLTLTVGTAGFELSIGMPGNDLVLTRRGATNAVSIELNALAPGGKSTWTINGKPAKAKSSMPLRTFQQLTELVITHQIVFEDGSDGAQRTFTQPMTTLRKQLEVGKGKITVK